MEYYRLNRGEDGACSMMMPPSATNSSNMASTPMLVFLSMFTAVIMEQLADVIMAGEMHH